MRQFLLRRGGGAQASAGRIFVAALALSVVGVLVQLAVTTSAYADPYVYVRRQVIYVIGALAVGGLAYVFGYRRAVAWSRTLLIGTWLLLGVLLLPGVAHAAGGSKRWIALGSFGHLQPSEVAKVALILFFAGFCHSRRMNLSRFREGFVPAMGYLGVTAGLVVMAPDLGQTVFIIATSACVLMVNGLRLRHFVPVILIALPLLVFVMGENWEYIGERVQGFLDGTHYQVKQGLVFLASGGAFGQPLGDGRAQLFVPELRNDFALVAVGENGGFVGCLVVIGLFLTIFYQGFRVALLARCRQGFSVAYGLSFMIALQAAVNVAVVTSTVPPKGIALPFVSFGGSSLLVNAAAVGLILSVARDARTPQDVLADLESQHQLDDSPDPTPTESQATYREGAMALESAGEAS